jgi:uncharacterized protein (DUF779 family)
MNRRFALDDAELGIHVTRAALVLLDEIDARHHNAIIRRVAYACASTLAPLGPNNALHFAFGARIVAMNHADSIALLDVHPRHSF